MTHPSTLTREAMAARDLIAALKDTIGDDDEFAMDVIEGETGFLDVIDRTVSQDREDQALLAGLMTYMKSLDERIAKIERRMERRRDALMKAIQTAGITKPIRCTVATVSLRTNPARVITTDPALIPAEFWRQPEPVLDRIALKAALKEGRTVPGATLSNGGVTVSIRTT